MPARKKNCVQRDYKVIMDFQNLSNSNPTYPSIVMKQKIKQFCKISRKQFFVFTCGTQVLKQQPSTFHPPPPTTPPPLPPKGP